jgi:predicted amidohydrolase
MAKVRVAAAQYPLDAFDRLIAHREKLSRWVTEAATSGAQLLVFPEYGAMEYASAAGAPAAADLQTSLQAGADARPEMDNAHAELARRHQVHILAASGPRRDNDRFVNTARLFTPDGTVGSQDKLMMTPFERNWGISSGECLRVFETALGRIGVAICYDSEFPLLVRAQAEAGADLILVPSCTEFLSGYYRVRTAALARALENGCATVISPTVGDAAWSPAVDRNTGAAGIFVPADHGFSATGVINEGTVDEPGWIYADIDLDKLSAVRKSGEMRNNLDWSKQPGATPLAQRVEIVSLS